MTKSPLSGVRGGDDAYIDKVRSYVDMPDYFLSAEAANDYAADTASFFQGDDEEEEWQLWHQKNSKRRGGRLASQDGHLSHFDSLDWSKKD